MSQRAKRVLKWILYPMFYGWLFLLFVYLTFPTDRAKARIEAEFNAKQDGDNPLSLTIGELDTYWFSGVALEGVELVGPPKVKEDGKLGKAERFYIDSARARASILSAIAGTLDLTFAMEAFGGGASGTYTDDKEAKRLELELLDLSVQQLPFLQSTTGLPMQGVLSGNVDLLLPGGKFATADGNIDLSLQGLRLGDGKTKIRDTLALPQINAGTLTLKAEVKEGVVSIQELKADGPDITVTVDGKVRLRDPVMNSLAEMNLKFKFKDAYRNKNDITAALLGKPGGAPGVLDLDPKVKRAKQSDESYLWRLGGPLSNMKVEPGAGGALNNSGSRFVRPSRATRPTAP